MRPHINITTLMLHTPLLQTNNNNDLNFYFYFISSIVNMLTGYA